MEEKKKNKPKYNMFQNVGFMVKLASKMKEKKVIVFVLLSAILFVANNLLFLYLSPTLLSVIETNGMFQNLIAALLFFVVSIMIVQGATAYVNTNKFIGRSYLRTCIVNMVNKKAATTSYINLSNDKFLKLLNKSSDMTRNDQEATQAIWQTMSVVLMNVLGFVIYVFLISHMNIVLLIVILVTTITGFFINRYFNEFEYRHRDENAEVYRKTYYANQKAPRQTAMKDIRIFGLAPWLEELYEKSLNLVKNYRKKVSKSLFWGSVADAILVFLRNGVAYAYLINMVINNEISVSEFLLYFSVVGEFSNWVNGILYHFNDLRKHSLDISILREFLEYEEPFKFEEGKELILNQNEEYTLKLENVSFRYPGSDKNILSNINLEIKSRDKIAVVGLNGAGKTTLVKIICGFLDPSEGRVLLNGQDIREYNRNHYYKFFSAVFQDFSILASTIAVNVAQDDENINYQKVEECLDKAGLKERINELPNKLDTLLEREVYKEAVALSGGETQRLMLARALYKDAPFVILDEPTAALDPIAESEIYQKYNEMTLSKASLFISHRLASTRFCDRVLLIYDSIIYEEGTHEELIKKGGKYAELFEVQSKYYQEGGEQDEKETSFLG